MKSIAKTATAVLTAFIIGSSMFFATGDANAQDSPEEIMKKSHLNYYYAADDGLADVEMRIINKKGRERVRKFIMLRKDFEDGGEQRYFTYFKEPSDVSRMTFMVWKFQEKNDNRWIYIPSLDLIRAIAANDKHSSFVGSDFTYEDVSGRHWTEDNHELLREDVVNNSEVYVIKNTPKDAKSAKYAYRISYISKANLLPLKEEYFDKKDNVIRLFEATKIEEIDGFHTITERVMTNIKKNNKTIVSFNNITYNTGVKDNVFSERFLRKPPREYIK